MRGWQGRGSHTSSHRPRPKPDRPPIQHLEGLWAPGREEAWGLPQLGGVRQERVSEACREAGEGSGRDLIFRMGRL